VQLIGFAGQRKRAQKGGDAVCTWIGKGQKITTRAAHGYSIRRSPALGLIVKARPLDDAVVRLTERTLF
jgi:hypothetical protein